MKRFTAQVKHGRHGMSLLEVLVALSLLAVLASVSITWMNAVTSKQREAMTIARWDRAAHAVLDQIARDLIQIDVMNDGRSDGEPRVWVEGECLCIRSPGHDSETTIRYMHEMGRQRFVRRSSTDQALSRNEPPMLGSVSDVQFTLTVPDEGHAMPELRVALRSAGGRLMERTFLLEQGDVAS